MPIIFSTKESLKILIQNNILPKVFLYFDDLNFSSSMTGELGAINDFNNLNKSKIENIPELAETMSMYWKKWGFLAKDFLFTTILIILIIIKDITIHFINI